MLVLTRYRYEEAAVASAAAELGRCLAELERCPGFVGGAVGRCVDEPTLWVVHTRWVDVGSYRRALSSYDVRIVAMPLQPHALDEPSAYEVISGEPAPEPNRSVPRRLGS